MATVCGFLGSRGLPAEGAKVSWDSSRRFACVCWSVIYPRHDIPVRGWGRAKSSPRLVDDETCLGCGSQLGWGGLAKTDVWCRHLCPGMARRAGHRLRLQLRLHALVQGWLTGGWGWLAGIQKWCSGRSPLGDVGL